MANSSFLRFALLLTLGIFVISVSGKDDEAALEKLILDTYKMTSDPKDEDFQNFLKAMEFESKDRKMASNAPKIYVTFKKEGDKQYNMQVMAGLIKVQDVTFTIGKEFDDHLFDGRHFKATVTIGGKNKVIRKEVHGKKDDKFTCTHESIFTEEGFTTNLECKGVKATQTFKRSERPSGL